MFFPLSVLANSQTITIDLSDGEISGNTVTYKVGKETVKVIVKTTINDNKTIVVSVDDLKNIFTFDSSFDSKTMNIVLYGTDGFRAYYLLQDDGTIVRDGNGGLPNEMKFKIEGKEPGNPEGPGESGGRNFEGSVFFAWNCSNKVCIAEINNLVPGGFDNYPMNYIKESDVVDFVHGDNTILDRSKLKNNDYFWLWDTSQLIIQDENINSSWNAFRDFFEKEENRREYAIDPCGAENGNNSIVTNGDRVFIATIYSDNNYESITFGTNKSDYKYFPDFWDNTFFSSTVDISGTTKDAPAEYQAYLLENTIKFETGDNSKYNITSVKALVENDNAVEVKNNNGVFEVKFKSNYYDKVLLELKDSNGNSYYVKVCRTVLQVRDNFGPNTIDPKLIAEVYYPDTKTYKDFELYATINYEDGTTKMVKGKRTEIIDKFSDAIKGLEDQAGEGLKKSAFEIDVTDDVVSVSFNVLYTNKSNDTFAGSFAGSGKGITYDIEERGIIYE